VNSIPKRQATGTGFFDWTEAVSQVNIKMPSGQRAVVVPEFSTLGIHNAVKGMIGAVG
jgi:hypothetical protein